MSTEYFPGQKPDEDIKTIVRPHWLNLLGTMVLVVLAAVLPIGLILLGNSLGAPELDGTARGVVVAVLGAYYATLVTFFFIRWLSVYLDVGIVTDQRVVDVDQRSLFSRNVAELDSKMVQDVAAEKTGFLRTIFDFGDVIIQTAGERPNFTFEGVPHPEKVVDLIQHSIADRNDDEGAATEEAVETMAEAAEKMAEAAETIAEPTGDPAANRPAGSPTPPDRPIPPPATVPAPDPAPEPSPPPRTAPPAAPAPPGQPDDLQDLPRDYEK